ncbi:VOC family protein [Streptomyces sp. NBC_01235]|uniref:VOC family protein n=1 Tax=Streptomyces sp. NBC_01235 TaxID=2903788 RepID=UPI002E1637BF
MSMKPRDNSALGRFWAEALGWNVTGDEPDETNVEPECFTNPAPIAVCIEILAVPEPKTARTACTSTPTTSAAHQPDLVARLEDLGATPVDVSQGDVPWTVFADREGNEFCVLSRSDAGRRPR